MPLRTVPKVKCLLRDLIGNTFQGQQRAVQEQWFCSVVQAARWETGTLFPLSQELFCTDCHVRTVRGTGKRRVCLKSIQTEEMPMSREQKLKLFRGGGILPAKTGRG